MFGKYINSFEKGGFTGSLRESFNFESKYLIFLWCEEFMVYNKLTTKQSRVNRAEVLEIS